MPGVVAVLRKAANQRICAKQIAADICGAMFNAESFTRRTVDAAGDLHVSTLHKAKDLFGTLNFDHILLVWYGRPTYRGRFLDHRPSATLETDLLNGGVESILPDLDGHFQLLMYDRQRRQCFAVADKVSTHPHYYVE